MRPIRDAVCLLVAVGSIALAAWQPAVATDRSEAEAVTTPAGVEKKVDDRVPQKIDRAVMSVSLLKA